jgi:undecaprenyl-diphosphatase
MTSPARTRTGSRDPAIERDSAISPALPWTILAILGLGGFAALTVLMAIQASIPFDGQLLAVARSWTAWTGAWDLLSQSANIPLVVLGVGTMAWLFFHRRRREAVLVFLVLAAATAGSEAVKQLIHRPRPPGSDTVVPGVIYSYPSGHVLEAVAVLGIIAVLLWRSRVPRVVAAAYAIGVAVFVALVAVARVAINAHYPTDVLAGFLAGVGVLAIFTLLSGSRAVVDDPGTSATHRSRATDTARDTGPDRPMAGGAGGAATPAVTGVHEDRPISPDHAPSNGATPATAPARTAASTALIVAGFVGVAACLVVFGLIAEAVRGEEAAALDGLATPFLHDLASPGLDAIMEAATFLGSNVVIVPAALVILVGLISAGRRREAVFLAVVVLGALVLNGAMKLLFQRPRPQLAWAQVLPDYSFPSGHTMDSLAFLLALAFIVWQVRGHRWGWVAVVLAVVAAAVVGLSRIYLGYHYLSDVIGGLLAAILWVVVVVAGFSGGERLLARLHRAVP